MLIDKLKNYINQTEDPIANYELGLAYESIGQIAAAISFYLRSVERTSDTVFQYELILKVAICFQILDSRLHTEQTLIHKALVLEPSRPEAYFLASKLYERKSEWQECYTYASLGLTAGNFDLAPVNLNNEYAGKVSLLFQQGLASYYVGMTEQAKEIMIDLKSNYSLNSAYETAVNNNLSFFNQSPSAVLDTTEIVYQPKLIDSKSPVKFNAKQRKGFWVVDNFYADPDAIREFALAQDYHQGGFGRGYIGRRTFQQFLFPGLKEEFERIMGEKITSWESQDMNGKFQYNTEGEPLVYHCDAQKWAAMIYLTPNAPFETGTGSFALKGTKVFHNSQEGIMAAFRGDGAQNLDKTLFEPVDSIGNVYNRLVIFNGGFLHAALGYFGYKPENARLWQMFFFD
jgi:tetratricopeptide (TPR) repeat protein